MMATNRKPAAVLVVEDEAILRMYAVDIVEEAGFEAIEARNADEAVAILEARSDIALLFTDIHMPGSMDGLKLAHAVHNRWPPVKIVIVSGHVELEEKQLPPGGSFYGKPFQADRMIKDLRRLVSAGSMSDERGTG